MSKVSSRRRKRSIASAVLTTIALGFTGSQAVAMPESSPVTSSPAPTSVVQDLRSPDAIDAAAPVRQDLRSPDVIDAASPVSVPIFAPAVDSSGSSWDEVGIISGAALLLLLAGFAAKTTVERRHVRTPAVG